MKVVIFSGGNIHNGYFVKKAIQEADLFIAADSGAQKAEAFGIMPHVIVGDFDSLSEKKLQEFKNKKVEIIASHREKDETDTELAVQTALDKGATEIFILGGTEENRLDHVLANVSLTRFSEKLPIYFINGNQKIWIEKGPKKVVIIGNKNDLLSLVPLTEVVTHIQTTNLAYPLLNQPLFLGNPKGISNVFLETEVIVEFTQGLLLFVQTAIDIGKNKK